jgi:large subunit ribosomal protein L25
VGLATETLNAKKRETSGTRACKRLRTEGQVPAVLYGLKEATTSIQVSAEELETAVRRRSRMFELHMGKEKDVVLLKEVQYDSFGDDIVHADFMRIALDQAITLEVPIQLKGAPKVEHAVLQQTLANVEIECLPKDIPEAIIAVVSDMKEGDSRSVKQLVAPPGVTILTDPDVIFATLTTIAEEVVAAAAAPAEAAGVEPEVIGRKEKLEEGEEAEEEAAPPKKEEKKKE